jgi:hypothetical protein
MRRAAAMIPSACWEMCKLIEINRAFFALISRGEKESTEFSVAFSSIMEGAGIIAGNPYFCSHGDANVATTK